MTREILPSMDAQMPLPLDAAAPVMPPIDTILREEPSDNEGQRQLISSWVSKVQESRTHWERKFKQMRKDADFARGMQWPGDIEPENETRYVANIVQRHIQQRVASLYAKNPRFVAKRREQLDFKVWDESTAQVQEALQNLQLAQQAVAMGDPNGIMMAQQAMAVLGDVQTGKDRRKLMDKIGKTMELLMANQLSEQQPPFKKQMKQLVRRTLTTSIGWLKIGFERVMEPRPEDADKIRDYTNQITELERLIANAGAEYDCRDEKLRLEELRQLTEAVKGSPHVIVREGLVFDFPPPYSVIIDKNCRQLHGFIGARFVAQEFNLPCNEVERIYGVDLKQVGYKPYDSAETQSQSGVNGTSTHGTDTNLARVYEIYDKTSRQSFTIAEGCNVYLREPADPEIKIDRFWPLFPLSFNDIEHEKEIYPPSDVELLKHMQREHNRAREALREHRQAAVPLYAAPRGALTDDDKDLLRNHDSHEIVELDGLSPTQKVNDLLQPVGKHGIDPNLYETNSIFDDVLKVAGVQEANIGGTSGATATETSVAEGARMASVASNVDDLDDFFNEVARAAGQILLSEFDPATVTKIVGPGAVWPQLAPQEISDELLLEIEAGSSGKPNKAVEVKNFQDMAPILMQIPGINPEWLARQALKRLDDRLDLTDAYLDGLPSIQALNQIQQTSVAPPGADPNQQGREGANNAPKPDSAAAQPNMHPAAGAAPAPGQAMSPVG